MGDDFDRDMHENGMKERKLNERWLQGAHS